MVKRKWVEGKKRMNIFVYGVLGTLFISFSGAIIIAYLTLYKSRYFFFIDNPIVKLYKIFFGRNTMSFIQY